MEAFSQLLNGFAVALTVVEIQEYELLPGAEGEAALDDRDRLRGPDDSRAHVGVGICVVVETVVLVVAVGRDQPLQRLAEIVHPARFVLHRRHGDRGPAAGHADDALLRAGGLHDAGHARRQVQDLAVAPGAESEDGAVHGHC